MLTFWVWVLIVVVGARSVYSGRDRVLPADRRSRKSGRISAARFIDGSVSEYSLSMVTRLRVAPALTTPVEATLVLTWRTPTSPRIGVERTSKLKSAMA